MPEPPTTTIADFLVALAQDPDRLAAFQADPEGELAKSGLTETQGHVILSGDASRIQHVVEYELGHAARVIVCAIVCRPRPQLPPPGD